MALSNALVPILPDLNIPLSEQAYLFSSYFFGAMIMTLPGGILCERYGTGKILKISLFLSVISGILMISFSSPVMILISRLIEGVGAGLFVSSALAWINTHPGHTRQAGLFMAVLNGGLLTGLAITGWIVSYTKISFSGILLFTLLCLVPLITILVKNDIFIHSRNDIRSDIIMPEIKQMIIRQAPLWYSIIVLMGITGLVQSVYPDLSGLPAHEIGLILALMGIATIISSIIAPYFRFEPVMMIKVSSILMIPLLFLMFTSSIAIFLMGLIAGFLMIFQITYLASAEDHQGVAMGLYSTASYAGMTIIPALGGTLIDLFSVPISFGIISLLALICVFTIGMCRCKGFSLDSENG